MFRIAAVIAITSACTPPRTRPIVQPPPRAETGYVLPAQLSTDRWFLDAKTAAGAPLRIYLDSAGGMFLTKAAVTRLHLPVEQEPDGDDKVDMVAFPALADTHIPTPQMPRVPVLDDAQMGGVDGMFGAPWFANHAFTFDYPARTLTLLAHALPDVTPDHRVTVAFQRDDAGAIVAPYGRIQMTVDGETMDMLLDTGATVTLNDPARASLGGDDVERATSFITKTVFDRWRAAHPDWRVIESADTHGNAPMIEVPKLTVGGYEVGPVWFTQRPDKAFHEWMAQWMDKPTEGALGGDAYRTLRLSVDWSAGAATFERP